MAVVRVAAGSAADDASDGLAARSVEADAEPGSGRDLARDFCQPAAELFEWSDAPRGKLLLPTISEDACGREVARIEVLGLCEQLVQW